MNDKTLRINAVNRIIGTLFCVIGIKKLQVSHSDFTTMEDGNNRIYQALKNIGITIIFSPKDFRYRYATLESWEKMIKVVNGIVKHFKWIAEYFDCDNRSDLVSALVSLFFEINTCNKLHCNVYDAKSGKFLYGHWLNMFVPIDGSVYIWDVDNKGMHQKITSSSSIMGELKYDDFKQVILN